MLQHITIQEISARYRDIYDAMVNVRRNNYHNIYFINSTTKDADTPTLYVLMYGRFGVIIPRNGTYLIRYLRDEELRAEAFSVAHKAVENKHPYLAGALEESEQILGLISSPNALF